MSEKVTQHYTGREEVVHALTHGIGALLSVAGLTAMVVRTSFSGDAFRIVGASVFGASMVLLYTSSTLYHSVRGPRLKRVFRVFDHICIYLLIAGTYTPFTLVSLRGGWGWSLLAIIWGLAFWGVVFKVFFPDKLGALTVAMYVAMGWLGVIAMGPMLSTLSAGGLFWLVAGGLMYTVGVAFYAWHRLHYNHAVWHLFVLAGTACHFFCIYIYVLPTTA